MAERPPSAQSGRRTAWRCNVCGSFENDTPPCPHDFEAHFEEVVVFDGEVCDHPITNGFGVCAGCGTDLHDD